MGLFFVERFVTKSGLRAVIVKQDMGYLCGYVEVPKTHPWYKRGYSEERTIKDTKTTRLIKTSPKSQIEVHGGITYSGDLLQKGKWFFGFDCAHSFDNLHFGGTPKDTTYVHDQCEKLADQLKKVTK